MNKADLPTETICMSLMDAGAAGELPVKVAVTPLGITIMPNGYGDYCSADGHGAPIFIERFEGRLRVIMWGDINQEDPTHCIYLDDAREDRRTD